MSGRALRRQLASRAMTAVVVVLSFTAVLALLLILGDLVLKGASSIDWAFFTKSPVPAGQSGGGVANAIVGTGIIVGTGDQAGQCGSSSVTEHELVGRRKTEDLQGRMDRDVAKACSGNGCA